MERPMSKNSSYQRENIGENFRGMLDATDGAYEESNEYADDPVAHRNMAQGNAYVNHGEKDKKTFSVGSKYSAGGYGPYDESRSFRKNGARASPYAGNAAAVEQSPRFNERSTGSVAHRTDGLYLPIASLNRFVARWSVRGRFVNRGDVRTYGGRAGEGKVWSIDLTDSPHAEGTIRCTFFNKAVDKFIDLIKENEIYSVSRGILKPKDPRFNQLKHQFEMQLREDAEIKWVAADDPMIPRKGMPNIVKIRSLLTAEKSKIVSICGVLTGKNQPIQITKRSTGEPTQKCDITLADDSGCSVDVTLWGNRTQLADKMELHEHPVVLVDGARIEEFNGRRLGTVSQTAILISPDLPIVRQLASWFRSLSNQETFESLSTSTWSEAISASTPKVTIAELQKRAAAADDAPLEDKGMYFFCRATLFDIQQNRPFYYNSCPECRRKVTTSDGDPDSGGPAFCDRCNKTVGKAVKHYILSLKISDHTGNLVVSAMAEKGELMMAGISADRLVEIQRGDNGFKTFGDYLGERIRRDYVFKLHAKSDTFREETRLRYRVVNLFPLNGYVSSDGIKSPYREANSLQNARKTILKEAFKVAETLRARLGPGT